MKNESRMSLGKGLAAILNSNEKIIEKKIVSNITEIPIEFIKINENQPRKRFEKDAIDSLSASISAYGIIQPITVKKISDESYKLISGERRLLASELAGLTKIPAYIRMVDEIEILELALVENIQREDLNAIEIASSYKHLIEECKLDIHQIARKVGKDRATISNYVRLLKLPADIQIAIIEDIISMGHARAIISLESEGLQMQVFEEIVSKGLSVRAVEAMVRRMHGGKKSEKIDDGDRLARVKELVTEFREILKTDVKIRQSMSGRGEINIKFNNQRELDRLVDFIKSPK